jgi:hypothetical protein
MGLGSALASASPAGSLKDLIKIRFKSEETVRPMKKDDWLRVSSLPSVCAREEVLAACKSIPRTYVEEPDLRLTFEHGHALHHQLQNSILPELGVIYGTWQCIGCGTVYGSKNDRIRRPDGCSKCKGRQLAAGEARSGSELEHEFKYVEEWYADEVYRIGGHPDAFIQMQGYSGFGILEAKSISQRSAVNIKHVPDLGHAIQLQVYLWLTNLSWGKILYWDKGTFGVNAWIEHYIERDDNVIVQVKELIRSIRDGIGTGQLPKRICSSSDCKRAEECSLSQLCFELPEDAVVEGA